MIISLKLYQNWYYDFIFKYSQFFFENGSEKKQFEILIFT